MQIRHRTEELQGNKKEEHRDVDFSWFNEMTSKLVKKVVKPSFLALGQFEKGFQAQISVMKDIK
jgi:hypothetical protein